MFPASVPETDTEAGVSGPEGTGWVGSGAGPVGDDPEPEHP